MPEAFGVTDLYMRLRVCERYGWTIEYVDGLGDGMLAVLFAQERVRGAEEAKAGTAG